MTGNKCRLQAPKADPQKRNRLATAPTRPERSGPSLLVFRRGALFRKAIDLRPGPNAVHLSPFALSLACPELVEGSKGCQASTGSARTVIGRYLNSIGPGPV